MNETQYKLSNRNHATSSVKAKSVEWVEHAIHGGQDLCRRYAMSLQWQNKLVTGRNTADSWQRWTDVCVWDWSKL